MSFLKSVLASTRDRLRTLPSKEPCRRTDALGMAAALRGRKRLSVVAELKRRSPSAGELCGLGNPVDPVEQALRYVVGGAAAVSVLTEPTHFGGSLQDLEHVCQAVDVPVLMKDFVIAPEQVRAAAALGASAVLLIVRIVSDPVLSELMDAARCYGLDALVECHDGTDLDRVLGLAATVPLIGINNRDLRTFRVDRANALRLSERLPAESVAVALSGYCSVADTAELRGRCDAVLIGTALMKSATPDALIADIRSGGRRCR